MDASVSHCNRLLVAALDFDTTYSGYAFSFQGKPLDIKYNPTWVAGSQQLLSLKTPTCVLLKPNKEFHSFGFEAENKYSDLAEDDEHHDWYLFRRFKMMLYNTKNLHLDAIIEDISGKKMSALTIFSHSIRYLNNHLLKTLNSQAIGVEPDDIQYIITVHAIWDQKAKQFMRRSANEAGIKDDQLRIALEPEAASIWCQVETDQKLSKLAEAGSKYMVVDLGGGTADITVHEKMPDGTLKELHTASGGSWGGTAVDKVYVEMMSEVVGTHAMQKFKTEHVGDYFNFLRDFESKKRIIKTDNKGKITLKIPAALKECAESRDTSMKDLIQMSRYRDKMTWTFDKIRVDSDVARSLFDNVVDELTNHVEKLLRIPKVSDIDAILLVGGFAECELVRASFQKKFANNKLIIPAEAGLAVLKGSVRFGHQPDIVSVRVARFTYGTKTMPTFDYRVHDVCKKITLYGEERCCDFFCIWVKMGEEIPCGGEIRKSGKPASVDQKRSEINIYSSSHEDPKYITDEGCTYLGKIDVLLPESGDISDKRHDVYLAFGSTELTFRVVMLKTNETYESVISCFE